MDIKCCNDQLGLAGDMPTNMQSDFVRFILDFL